jgi:hypothetical protein
LPSGNPRGSGQGIALSRRDNTGGDHRPLNVDDNTRYKAVVFDAAFYLVILFNERNFDLLKHLLATTGILPGPDNPGLFIATSWVGYNLEDGNHTNTGIDLY